VINGGTRGPNRLIGRDAFSGVQLWSQELSITSQYSFLLDDQRVYLLRDSQTPVPMEALDLKTGAAVLRYDEGMKLRTIDFTGRMNQGPTPRQWPWPQALTLDGVLVQRFAQNLHALDTTTGKLLWKADLAGDELFGYIAASDGLVLAAEGAGFGTSNAYIPGFSRQGLRRIVARQLKTGQLAWTWQWSGPKREFEPEICHLAIGPGQVGIAAVQKASKDDKAPNGEPAKGWGFLVNLDLKSGKENWAYQHIERYNSGWMGLGLGGHSYFRTYFHSGRQWMVEFSRPRPYDPKTKALTKEGEPWSYNFRCHPGRTSAELAIGSLFIGSFKDSDLAYFCETARAPCDVGTFPANGLIYQPTNGCPCHAWMINDNAYSAEAPPKPLAGERLERGAAKPASAPAGAWPAPSDWPMHLRDSLRSSWVETSLAAAPKIVWTVKPETRSTPHAQVQTEWQQMLAANGQHSSPSHAEGLVAVAAINTQAVIGLDPKTGRERWRTQVEGRVDSAPTIYKGLVLLGTRAGWIYALNRDDGKLAWRFLAAPAGRNIVANGQVESSWPLYGTVAIVNDTLWVAAGRDMGQDDGVWWWGIDPLTGAVRKQHQTGFSGEWQRISQMPNRKDDRGRERKDNTFGRAGGNANLPLVSDGRNLFAQGFGLDLATGQRIPAAGRAFGDYADGKPVYAQPGMYGFVWAGDHMTAGQQGAAAWFGTQAAKAFAWRGRQAVGIAMNRAFISGRPAWEGGQHFGLVEIQPTRDEKSGWMRQLWLQKLPGKGRDSDLGRSARGVAVAGETVVLLSDRNLVGAALADGAQRWSIELPAMPMNGGLAIADGQITVVCEDGSIVGVR
jgi:outer membrane protein assembly factor BamB